MIVCVLVSGFFRDDSKIGIYPFIATFVWILRRMLNDEHVKTPNMNVLNFSCRELGRRRRLLRIKSPTLLRKIYGKSTVLTQT